MKIKKGDKVQVMTGKDKGKSGVISRVLIGEGKVVVDGLNIRKRHKKGARKGDKGQILELSMPMDVSNVMLVDPKTKKPTRVGYKIEKDGKKVRIAKKSGATV